MSNKLYIAAAGSGKTRLLVQNAINYKDSKVLITTFTQANETEIIKKFIELNKCVPQNVTIQTWFSFLLQHGVRPYQGCKCDKEITGLVLSNGQSAIGIAENNTEKHYFTDSLKIYSDKLSKFVIKCNELSNSAVIDRLSRIYNQIYIDEVQDLAGYDLNILKLLFASNINIILVGDPRQGTYSTNNSRKNKRYSKSGIIHFFEDESIDVESDDTTLTTNYRSIQEVCDFSNKLYPDFSKTISGNNNRTGHDGVFLIRKIDIDRYLNEYNPIQLTYDIRAKVNHNFEVINMGLSKGLEFNRVLIYPTANFSSWLEDNDKDLSPTVRSKFYVAITRAKYSVGIVYDYDDNTKINGAIKFV